MLIMSISKERVQAIQEEYDTIAKFRMKRIIDKTKTDLVELDCMGVILSFTKEKINELYEDIVRQNPGREKDIKEELKVKINLRECLQKSLKKKKL